MTIRVLSVLVLSWLFLPLTAADRVALVIGINDYPADSNFPDLKNCILDAELIRDTLEEVDFEVVFVENPTRSEMDAALLDFEGRIEKGGTALVYYAGHGIELDGQNYLMASNAKFKARSRLSEEAFNAETVGSAMVLAGAKSSFLLLDCCREIPADAEWATRGSKRYGLAEITIPGDIMIGLAAAPGKPALEPRQAGENGPYARALAKWIPTGLDHLDLFQKVRQEVDSITEGAQRTWEKGSFLAPFYFAEGAETPGMASNAQVARMAELEKQIAALKKLVLDLEKAGTENEALREQLAEMEAALLKEKAETNGDPKTMAVAMSDTRTAYPADSDMIGSKAGETRSFGGIEFVWCPPGEIPQDFELDVIQSIEEIDSAAFKTGFWIAKTECTQPQWKSILGRNPSEFSGENRPVENVTWNEVEYWMVGMNRTHPLPSGWKWSLPSARQWIYACRAGRETDYGFGDDDSLLYRYANFADKNLKLHNDIDEKQDDGVGDETSPVGTYLPNDWGIFDMHGNVMEWNLEGYDKEKEKNGEEVISMSSDGFFALCRGGSWMDNKLTCGTQSYYLFQRKDSSRYQGFRPVLLPAYGALAATGKPAYPTDNNMTGSKAGDTRTFGGIEFVWCPPTGKEGFLMGSPEGEEGRDDDETQHRVILTNGFWLAKTECTQGQWKFVTKENPSRFKGSESLPVDRLSWDEVNEWLDKMNESHSLPQGWKWKLPTEAQWEYACRAGTNTTFSMGNSLGSDQANFDGSVPYGSAEKGKFLVETARVGSFEANPWGLQDMHGNVWEWCADLYGQYPRETVVDPGGVSGGSEYVLRGGSWYDGGHSCRSANRSHRSSEEKMNYPGFRPALVLEGDPYPGGQGGLEREKIGNEQAMAIAKTETTPAYPADNNMIGSKAGDTRTFGGIEFVWCPPTGEEGFLMGSPDYVGGEEKGEREHTVVLKKGFWMAKTECTQADWKNVMENNPSEFSGIHDLPVENVSWLDVEVWLAEMNARHSLSPGWKWALPTEAEWEYACRAETTTLFGFGVSLSSSQANFDGRNPSGVATEGPFLGKTISVGSYQPNKWGLHDMHGNVWEWCWDWYQIDYFSDGLADVNPTGPPEGAFRVIRGGGWKDGNFGCRSSNRDWNKEDRGFYFLGFRPVIVSTEPGDPRFAEVDGVLSREKSALRSMAVAKTETKPALPADNSIIGSKAGDTRTFGGIEFVWCPPTGEAGFLMGSPEDEEGRDDDESQHRVILANGFWLAKTECTQGQWEGVMGSESVGSSGGSDLPVEQASWYGVQEWLKKMNQQQPLAKGWQWSLPTEAQWEYACRADSNTVYSFGDTLDREQANTRSSFSAGIGYSQKLKVGILAGNTWGLKDMHGNLSEWCADWYGEYPAQVVTDPNGPSKGFYRVYRGGSFRDEITRCRSAERQRTLPTSRDPFIGFRPAISYVGE